MNCYRNNLKSVFLSYCVFFSAVCFAQSTTLDSLKKVLEYQRADTNKVDKLQELCISLLSVPDLPQTLPYALEALELSKKNNYTKGRNWCYFTIASAKYETYDYIGALNYCDSGLQFHKQLNDSFRACRILQLTGMIHFVLGDTAEALIKYNDALKFETMKDIDDKIMLSQIHNLIGDIFCKQGRYAEALEKHYAALKICEVPGFDDDGWNRAYSFQCIGDVYKEMGDAEIGKGNKKQAKNCYTKATEINEKARSLWIEVDDIRGLAQNDYVFGHIYFKIGDIKNASKYFNKSFAEYKKANYSEGLNDLYLDMARLDSARGNYKRAFEFHKLYVIENKKREDQNVIRKAAGFKYKSKIGQREAELKLLSAENKLQSEVSHRNRQNKNIAYGVLVLVMLASGLAFYIFRKRKRIIENSIS